MGKMSGMVTVTWATILNEKHWLRSATYESPHDGQAAGEPVTAMGNREFLATLAGWRPRQPIPCQMNGTIILRSNNKNPQFPTSITWH